MVKKELVTVITAATYDEVVAEEERLRGLGELIFDSYMIHDLSNLGEGDAVLDVVLESVAQFGYEPVPGAWTFAYFNMIEN